MFSSFSSLQVCFASDTSAVILVCASLWNTAEKSPSPKQTLSSHEKSLSSSTAKRSGDTVKKNNLPTPFFFSNQNKCTFFKDVCFKPLSVSISFQLRTGAMVSIFLLYLSVRRATGLLLTNQYFSATLIK